MKKEPLHLKIFCGDSYVLEKYKEVFLEDYLYSESQLNYIIIVDEPLGWALLNAASHTAERSPVIFVSRNPCPTYLRDLMSYKPKALITELEPEMVISLVTAVSLGARIFPQPDTPLTASESHVIYLLAQGYTNAEIASIRDVKLGTVKNSVHTIYEKLNLQTRVQAAYYYFGQWHLLENWTRPKHVTKVP